MLAGCFILSGDGLFDFGLLIAFDCDLMIVLMLCFNVGGLVSVVWHFGLQVAVWVGLWLVGSVWSLIFMVSTPVCGFGNVGLPLLLCCAVCCLDFVVRCD